MRYGENPHQQAAYYQERYPQPGSLAGADHSLIEALVIARHVLIEAAITVVDDAGVMAGVAVMLWPLE